MFVFRPEKARPLTAVFALFFVCTGCAVFRSTEFDIPEKPRASLQRTNFRVRTVSAGPVQGNAGTGGLAVEKVKSRLQELEDAQNGDLMPVQYDLEISRKPSFVGPDDWNGTLFALTLGIFPKWSSHRWDYDATATLPSSRTHAEGYQKLSKIDGWLMLLVCLPQYAFGGYDNAVDYQFGMEPAEPLIAEAVFATLTEDRYEAEIEAMSRAALARLKRGEVLTGEDERILDSNFSKDVLAARAKHPGNLQASLKALEGIDDAETLVDIARGAHFPLIRRNAASKVSGLPERRFAELAESAADADVGRTFLEKVSDEEILVSVVEAADALEEVKTQAAARIGSGANLRRVAVSRENVPLDVRLDAAKRIDDPRELAVVVQSAPDSAVRREALSGVSDQTVLAKVVASDFDNGIRLLALARLADSAAIAEVVRENDSPEVRLAALKAALKGPANEDLFVAAAKDSNPEVRALAMSKVADEALLAEAAVSDSSALVRTTAVRRIKDRAVLLKLLETASDEDVRLWAVKHLSGAIGEETLAGIVASDASPRVRIAALEQIRDSAAIEGIALRNDVPEVRLAALRAALGSPVSGDFLGAALKDSSPDVRVLALSRIADDALLAEVAASDPSAPVRMAAAQRIQGQTDLVQLLKATSDESVRNSVAKRLSDESKAEIGAWLERKAKSEGRVSIRGFSLGMDETDARILFAVLLPGKSVHKCAVFRGGTLEKLSFSPEETAALLGKGRPVSVSDIPRRLVQETGCSMKASEETVEHASGTVVARQTRYVADFPGEGRLTVFATDMEEDERAVDSYARMSRFNAPDYEYADVYASGVRIGLKQLVKQAQEKAVPAGTIIWSR